MRITMSDNISCERDIIPNVLSILSHVCLLRREPAQRARCNHTTFWEREPDYFSSQIAAWAGPRSIVQFLSDCMHKDQYSDRVISELINFLHKSLPEHDPDEQISLHPIACRNSNIETKLSFSWSVFFTNPYPSTIQTNRYMKFWWRGKFFPNFLQILGIEIYKCFYTVGENATRYRR